jgi:hypothetical protein
MLTKLEHRVWEKYDGGKRGRMLTRDSAPWLYIFIR